METISQVLFWVANSLLIPDILLLLLLFIRALLLVGGIYRSEEHTSELQSHA